MGSVWSVPKLTACAIVWRPVRTLQFVGLPSLLVCVVALTAVRIGFQFLAAGPGSNFNPYGLNAAVAWAALDVAVAALFVRPAARATALSAMLLLLIVAELFSNGLQIATHLPAIATRLPARVTSPGIFVVVSLWWIGAMVAVLRTFSVQPRRAIAARAVGLWVALLAVSILIPQAPVFVGRNFNTAAANWWELLHAPPGSQQQTATTTEAAPLEQSQEALVQAQTAALAASTKGATAVYALGIDGWEDEVFLKELDGGLAALGNVLPIRGRVVRLINNRTTLQSAPLADRRNFAAAVHAVAALMNKDDDIFILFMTSHGEPTGFGLKQPNGALSELTPQEVAATLNNEGIKNRIVVVSACYSGTFVPPLADDDTIVLTASDAQHTSFGCAPERDWTYFGDAFFRQSVHPGRDLQQAFESARVLISGWERMDRATPSNPQGHFGPALVAKLAALQASSPPSAGQ